MRQRRRSAGALEPGAESAGWCRPAPFTAFGDNRCGGRPPVTLPSPAIPAKARWAQCWTQRHDGADALKRRPKNLGIKGEGELKKLLQEAGRDTRRVYVRHTPPRSAQPAKAPSRPPGDGWIQYEDHGVPWWYYEGPLGKWWWFCKDGQEPAPVRKSDGSDELISICDSDECWV